MSESSGIITYYCDDSKVDAPNVFVQWKGTDVCLDFYCECGAEGHFDGYFCYAIRCRECGALYEMPSVFSLKKVANTTATTVEPELDDDC